MLDLESAIKHCEEVAEKQEKAAKEWHENQVRECEPIRFPEMDYTRENECKKCAEEHRQLAIWLTELKTYRSMWQDLRKMVLGMADTDTNATQMQACRALYHIIKVYESRLDNDKQLENKYLSIYRTLYEIEKDIKEDIAMINKGKQEKECFKPIIEIDKLVTVLRFLEVTKGYINDILDDIEK